jgi:hypothetical protein
MDSFREKEEREGFLDSLLWDVKAVAMDGDQEEHGCLPGPGKGI